MKENQVTEFKRQYVDDIKKEVVAFANAEGGSLFIGIDDTGVPVGVDDPDETMTKASNSLRDGIKPDLMPFIHLQMLQMDGKDIIRIDVEEGSDKPYYLRDKGLKPAGVYIRKGTAKQPVSEEGIRKLIIETGSLSYETARSMRQDLTFETFTAEMAKRNIPLGSPQMKTLGLIGNNGLYTNLGALLSDQCSYSTKVAIFQGMDKTRFKARQEFSGSILKQLNDVYEYLCVHDDISSTIEGLIRQDQYKFPLAAVREALLNSLCHRDYAFSGPNIINIYDDRMEFISLGGLLPGLSLEAIFLGISQSRNPHLANVLYRMKLIESYGTGIAKIKNTYAHAQAVPQFNTAEGAFRVILPAIVDKAVPTLAKESAAFSYTQTDTQQEAILRYIRERGSITRRQAEAVLNTKATRAYTVLKDLVEQRKIIPRGSGRTTVYILAKI